MLVSGEQGGGPGLMAGFDDPGGPDDPDDLSQAPQLTGTSRSAPLGTLACGNTPRQPSWNRLQELRPLWVLGRMWMFKKTLWNCKDVCCQAGMRGLGF